MPVIDTADLISVSDANKKGVSGLIREAEMGREQVVLRNNQPVAAVVSMDRLERMQEIEATLLDVSLGIGRLLTTSTRRHSLDDVLAQFGYTREELRELGDA